MLTIPEAQVIKRIQTENVWWLPEHSIGETYSGYKPRAYLKLFYPHVLETKIKRAVLLMGPRRVGKTVLLHHAIDLLIKSGVDPINICYISVDHPIYTGSGLEDLLNLYIKASGTDISKNKVFVIFDEIQYLKGWEVHLKVLVDSYENIKFIASGSAAAALRLKSIESGAGRFTDFLLPPLTFHEYLDLLGISGIVNTDKKKDKFYITEDIEALNRHFLHYLNYGGYPEVIFSEKIQSDPARYIKSDIIDKVLLRDLPSLYGIHDIQELNYLFTTLAYNTANEVTLENLSQNSGVAKNTIKRYIEYLQAAFLIRIVHRIDRNSKRFIRANFFKVYLTNPSVRAALFSPVGENDKIVGSLAETGIFSQWFHASHVETSLYYARWNQGEIDIVNLDTQQKPKWAVEVKWSDRLVDHPNELRQIIGFCHANNMESITITTRSKMSEYDIDGVKVEFVPSSIYCFTVGYNLIKNYGIRSIAENINTNVK